MALAAVLVALLTLPFHPFWMDMEQVRRAGLLGLVGILCLFRPRSLLAPLQKSDILFLLFIGWNALGVLHSSNQFEALYRVGHLTALFALFRWGRGQSSELWLRAILPAALVIAAYGLLQSLGLELPAHYASPAAPVSTLGNLNVASEFVAVATAAALVLCGRGKGRLSGTALVLGMAYLVANGSRSGLVAVPAALLWLLVTGRGMGDRRILLVSLPLLGFGLGTALAWLQPAPADSPAPAAQASTIEVRLEMWKGCWDMALDAPLLGHGPGQFKVQYPRFRTQREIELSTNQRQFPSHPRVAHNDPLEILVEGGWPGLLLALGFAIAAFRELDRQGRLPYLTPLACFALLSLVRSPLGNAPVAAWSLVYLGALLPSASPGSSNQALAWCARLLGLLLFAAGVPVIVSQTLAAPYLSAKAYGEQPDPLHLERAVSWTSFDTNLHELLAQEHMNREPPGLPDAERHLAALEALAPQSTFRLVWVVKEALLAGDLPRAQGGLDRLRVLDPGHIEASTLQSTVDFLRGDHRAAIEAVYRNPHWRLREHLPAHMQQLATRATERGELETARIYACEIAFLAACDGLRQSLVARSAVEEVLRCFTEAGQLRRDIRPWLLMAIQFHGLDDEAQVEDLAEQVQQLGLPLSPLHRDLLGELLDPLREYPGWRALLGG